MSEKKETTEKAKAAPAKKARKGVPNSEATRIRSGNVTVYNRQGERLIWKATFSLTRDDIRQLARELRHVSQLLDAENETQEEK